MAAAANTRPGLGRFRLVLFGVTALVHLPFGLGASYALGLAGAASPGLVASALTLSAIALVRVPLAYGRDDRPRSSLLRVLVEEPYFAHFCASFGATVFLLPAWAAASLAALVRGPLAAPSASAVACALYAFFLPVALYATFVRRSWVRLRTIDVEVPGLPSALDGYRIAHLSDLHIGGYTPRARAERWRDRVNALDVDLVAFTGDYVTSGVRFHRDIAEVMGGFRAKDGAIAVMGNHDYFGDGEPLVALLRAHGVTVLRNERTTLQRGDSALEVAGVDDTWTRKADVARAMNGLDRARPTLVLAHDPQLFPAIAAAGGHVVLAGHTHWGQVAVPFLATRLNMSRLTYRYHAGLYREGASTLVIHPGLGTTGPPVRLGAAPEITVVRLRAARGEALATA